jgi:hypothetical protein
MKHSVEGMNVLLFLTDQERAIQHFLKVGPGRTFPENSACGGTDSPSRELSATPVCVRQAVPV